MISISLQHELIKQVSNISVRSTTTECKDLHLGSLVVLTASITENDSLSRARRKESRQGKGENMKTRARDHASSSHGSAPCHRVSVTDKGIRNGPRKRGEEIREKARYV